MITKPLCDKINAKVISLTEDINHLWASNPEVIESVKDKRNLWFNLRNVVGYWEAPVVSDDMPF